MDEDFGFGGGTEVGGTTTPQEEKTNLEVVLKRKNFSIRIGYINSDNENIARIVKVNDSFVIYLSNLKSNVFLATKPKSIL